MNKNRDIFQLKNLVLASLIAACYIVLTLPFASFAFGPLQFRLAEALTALPVLLPAAVPGVFVGCFVSNILNPDNLGPIDIFGGSFTTLLAACLTYVIAKKYREEVLQADGPVKMRIKPRLLLALLPPVLLNGLIVGYYVAILTLEAGANRLAYVMTTMASITITQALVIYLVGVPLLYYLQSNPVLWQKYLSPSK